MMVERMKATMATRPMTVRFCYGAVFGFWYGSLNTGPGTALVIDAMFRFKSVQMTRTMQQICLQQGMTMLPLWKRPQVRQYPSHRLGVLQTLVLQSRTQISSVTRSSVAGTWTDSWRQQQQRKFRQSWQGGW